MVPIILDLMDMTVTESEAKRGSRKDARTMIRSFDADLRPQHVSLVCRSDRQVHSSNPHRIATKSVHPIGTNGGCGNLEGAPATWQAGGMATTSRSEAGFCSKLGTITRA